MSGAGASSVTYNRVLRKAIHILAGAGALTLKFIPYPAMVGAAVAAVALSFIPGKWIPFYQKFAKPEDVRAGGLIGVRYYFIAVALVIAIWGRANPEIPTAAWLILAVADGLSGIVGRKNALPIPYNRSKTSVGSIAFLASAFGCVMFTYAWFGVPIADAQVFSALVIALATAFVESLPPVVDDNLMVGVASGILLYLSNVLIK